MGSQKSKVEGQDQPPGATGQAAFDTAQDRVVFLGCTLPAQCTVFHLPVPQNTCLLVCLVQGTADNSDLQSL